MRGRRLPLVAFAVSAVLLFAYLTYGTRSTAGRFSQKLLILGFDGMDPDLVSKWMDEGRLPNMQRLARQGGMYPLATTHSPESPTAWASFATGVNPGKHNIYDFL